jgi:hypothetical protein
MARLPIHQRGSGGGMTIVVIAVILIVGFILLRPEALRTPIQTPVSVNVRESLVGLGNVVQVKNISDHLLFGVIVTGKNSAKNQSATYRVGNLAPGDIAEIGWMEWSWTVEPGEQITVSADGYLLIVFSAEQLGVKQ